jgi:hypothetical protein
LRNYLPRRTTIFSFSLTLLAALALLPVTAFAATTTISDPASCKAAGGRWQTSVPVGCEFSSSYTIATGDTLIIEADTLFRAGLVNNGTLTVSEYAYVNQLVNNPGATINIEDGHEIQVNDESTNYGTINIKSEGVFLMVAPLLTNAVGGQIIVSGDIWLLTNEPTIINHGTISLLCGSQVQNSQYITGNPPQYADCTGPTASASAKNADGSTYTPGSWTNQDVTVSWNWSDNDGGSGVDPTNCTTTSTSSGEGVLTLNASCQDLAGNTNSASYTVKVDKTGPVVTATPDRAANANGWYNAPATFNFSGNDGSGSGVVKCDPAKTYSGPDSATASVTGTCIDKAGNVGSATANLKYDATTPTVTYTGNAGTYTLDQIVSITCKPSDNLSGIASSTCANITGPAYTFAASTNTFSASATDKAGNIGTGSTTFTVGVTYDDLCTLSAKFSTDPNVDKGLCDKLVAAKAAAARGDLTAKNNILGAYRQQVAAQTGKALTADQAAILTRLSRAF